MTRDHVRNIVVAELLDVQKTLGNEPVTVTDSTRPIGDIGRFDSPVSLVVAVKILTALCGTPPDPNEPPANPFTARQDGLYPTVQVVVDQLCQQLHAE